MVITKNKNDTNEIVKKRELIDKVIEEIHKKVIWQDDLIHILLIGLLIHGHILLEWVPGIAKTLTIDSLAKSLHGNFKRIQFTPDLLPSDLIGTEIYNQWTQKFEVKKWPIFTNFLLADEINRASSKVQSALLEWMAEGQVTIWEESFSLELPFLVLATQNPIEQAGTYKLPEAQLDRFMLKVVVDYPQKKDEKEIMKRIYEIESTTIKQVLKKKDLQDMQNLIKEVHISDVIFDYINDIIFASRFPEEYELDDLAKYISYGFSPRGSLALFKASQAEAFLDGRDFVLPEDVKKVAPYALTHRLVTNYEAIADNISNEYIVERILDSIPIR